MHGAVLQKDDYIDFAEENTVEVMALGRLDEAIKKEAKRAGTYDTVDAEGKPVKYLVEWPGLTVEDIKAMRGSKAGQYNDTGKIPYTAIIDPYTEEKMKVLPGGRSAGQLMDAVTEMRKKLNGKHGPTLSRKDIRKFEEVKAECGELLEEKGAGKALGLLKKNAKKLNKKGERIAEMVTEYRGVLMEKAGEELDGANDLIDEGEMSKAKKILGSLKSVVKKTPLEARVTELYEKIKVESAKSAE
jgi:hypothetical protein